MFFCNIFSELLNLTFFTENLPESVATPLTTKLPRECYHVISHTDLVPKNTCYAKQHQVQSRNSSLNPFFSESFCRIFSLSFSQALTKFPWYFIHLCKNTPEQLSSFKSKPSLVPPKKSRNSVRRCNCTTTKNATKLQKLYLCEGLKQQRDCGRKTRDKFFLAFPTWPIHDYIHCGRRNRNTE